MCPEDSDIPQEPDTGGGILNESDLQDFIDETPEELRSITEDSPEAGLLAQAMEEQEMAATEESENAATQADLDALLTATEGTALDGQDDDSLIVENPEPVVQEAAPVAEPVAEPVKEEQAEAEEEAPISQDVLDSLIAASNITSEEVGSENLAAAATTPGTEEPKVESIDPLEMETVRD